MEAFKARQVQDPLATTLHLWFSARPRWLQNAAHRLLQARLEPEDLDELTDLCKQEAANNGARIDCPPLDLERLQRPSPTKKLRLHAIKDVKGINALAPKKPLEIGKNDVRLTIVYGDTGSGKSSYVRILKHACGAKLPGNLHPNAFSKEATPQSCTFSVSRDGEPFDIEWNAQDGPQKALRTISIYDSACGREYVEKQNEVTLEPAILSFLSMLIDICEKVAARIQREIECLPSQLPQIPPQYAQTASGKWLARVGAKTTTAEIAAHCSWNKEQEVELVDLRKRLSEKDPVQQAKEIRAKKARAAEVYSLLRGGLDALSDSACTNLLKLRSDAETAKAAATKHAETVFSGAPLDGIGSDVWKLLWEQARVYSEQHAYPGSAFPKLDEAARCVLCQQPLDEDAKTRLQHFEDFVKGGLARAARAAEKTLQSAIQALLDFPLDSALKVRLDAAGISSPELRAAVEQCCRDLQSRKNSIVAATKAAELKPLPKADALNALRAFADTLETQAAKFDEDAKKSNRAELLAKQHELEARQWLSQQIKSVEIEIGRQATIAKLNKALGLTKTSSLTSKKNELAGELVSAGFISAFNAELTKLGASRLRLKIEKQPPRKGRILHLVRLNECHTECPVNEVLSEGEFRVASLAAFLADLEASRSNTPFIFDDPISSLDQDFEENIARRLVELSKTRQVIVFTHRLSLLANLFERAAKEKVKREVLGIRRFDDSSGEPSDIPITANDPTGALNVLLKEKLPRIRKAAAARDVSQYDSLRKELCLDFRVLVERFVETNLCDSIVLRFRRAINTQGKLINLTKVTADDCNYIDGLMTKYSRYKHSQSDEAPVSLPEPDEIEADLKELSAWNDEYRKRKAA